MFKEIGQKETDQSVHISGCREMCRLLNQSLDTKKEILLKSRATNNSISTFVTYVKVAKFLRNTEQLIEQMETVTYTNTIDFKINEELEDMLKCNSIGDVYSKAPEQAPVRDTAENTESKLNIVRHKIDNIEDTGVVEIEKLLCDSREIETGFLEPFLHFIQMSTNAYTTKDWELVDGD